MLEIDAADANNQRMNLLESKMSSIDGKLKEMMTIMQSKSENEAPPKPARNLAVPAHVKNSIWNDPEKLASVKAPPARAALIIPKNPNQQIQNENKNTIEKTLLDNRIPLKSTYTNQAGELVLVCESAEKRDELKNLVHAAKDDIQMSTPKVKKCSITIVGLTREYSEQEVKHLFLQNSLIKKFSESNDINDHLEVHSIKPLQNNQNRFQVFATVSQVLREGINKANDKLVMGISSCKVYDRRQIRRCFNCQKFGHLAAKCTTPRTPSCGKCSGDHNTKECTSINRGCINCKRENLDHSSHSAFYHKCPVLVRFDEQQQQNKSNGLNSTLPERTPPW